MGFVGRGVLFGLVAMLATACGPSPTLEHVPHDWNGMRTDEEGPAFSVDPDDMGTDIDNEKLSAPGWKLSLVRFKTVPDEARVYKLGCVGQGYVTRPYATIARIPGVGLVAGAPGSLNRLEIACIFVDTAVYGFRERPLPEAHRSIVHVLRTDVLESLGGRMIVFRGDLTQEMTAELLDANGAVERKWSGVLGRGHGRDPTVAAGALTGVWLKTGASQHALLLLDWKLQPMGEPLEGVQELATSRAVQLGLPVPGEKDLFKVLVTDGSFAPPPGTAGVRPLTPAVWIAAYDTPQGRRWGWLSWSDGKLSPPLWKAVELAPAPNLSVVREGSYDGKSPKVLRYYYVVQQEDGGWVAILPYEPLRAAHEKSCETAQEAVAAAEAPHAEEVKRLLAIAADEAVASKTAPSRGHRTARARVNAGATFAKDSEYDSMKTNYDRYGGPHLDMLHRTAKRLGPLYVVEYVEWLAMPNAALLAEAASAARSFDAATAANLDARARGQASIEQSIAADRRRAEERRKAEHAAPQSDWDYFWNGPRGGAPAAASSYGGSSGGTWVQTTQPSTSSSSWVNQKAPYADYYEKQYKDVIRRYGR